MGTRDTFSGFHPVVNLVYFVLVLALSMVLTHPACTAVSLAAALCYGAVLTGGKGLRRTVLLLAPMALLAAAVNVLFNHEGATILTWFPSGNPLTLESMAYALGAAGMLCALVSWFACFNQVMTSDKLVYLFGRVIPALSLVISMTLRFVPKFKAQFQVVAEAQKCAGRDPGSGRLWQRAKNLATVFSILVTWSLENGIETADSMKSRGYGLPGRTAFALYTFDRRDRLALGWLSGCGAVLLGGAMLGGFSWQYYPVMRSSAAPGVTALLLAGYLALCLTPVVIHGQSVRTWKKLQEETAA